MASLAARLAGAAARRAWRAPLQATAAFHSTPVRRETFPVALPALSPTMTEGTIVKWHFAEGEEVAVGDTLFEMETDKAIMSVESMEDGYLAKILIPEGTAGVPINKLVALMTEDEGEEAVMPAEEAAAPAQAAAVPAAPAPAPAAAAPAPAAAPAAPAAQGATAKPLSPAVLALVNRHGLDAAAIPASGPKGHILKGDVLAFLSGEAPAVATATATTTASAPAATAAPGDAKVTYTDTPTTTIRKVIAARLTESKTTIPHSYTSIDVDMGALMKLRTTMKEDHGIKFSFNDAIIKASAIALRTNPAVNSQFSNGEVIQQPTVDISVAVATPTGLITPIVTGADGRGLTNISSTVRELAGRAREGKLQPHEFQGGSFSVSNLGMMGITKFSAVINPPQACILAVGAPRPVVKGTPEDFEIKQMATFTLSSDARVCNDEEATKWLTGFKGFMENPQTML